MSVQLRARTLTRRSSPSSGDPRDWRLEAACRDADPDLFFHPDGWHGGSPGAEERARVRAALAICDRCPVESVCLAEAVSRREPEGIWGGVVFTSVRGRGGRAMQPGMQGSSWSAAEDAVVLDESLTCVQAADRLPGRTASAVENRRRRLRRAEAAS